MGLTPVLSRMQLSRLKQPWYSLKQSPVLLNIVGLATATTLSQLLVMGAAPVITRLYEPKAFGIFSAYLSVVAIVGSFSGLRFEAAIPVPRSENLARALSVLAIGSTIFISLAVASALISLDFDLVELDALHNPYVFLAATGSVIAWGLFRTLQQWVIRRRVYRLLQGAVVMQTFLQVAIQIILGAIQPAAMSLVSSDFARAVAGALYLGGSRARLNLHMTQVKMRHLYVAAVRYSNFAFFSSVAALLNAVSNWFLPIVMATTYDFKAAGLVGLCQRIVGSPTSVIANSVAKIYAGELAISKRNSVAEARKLFKKTAWFLTAGGVLVVVGIGIPGLILAGVIFGPGWNGIGGYVFVLSFSYAAKLIAFPLGATLDIYKAQRAHLAREVIRITIIVVGLSVSILARLPAFELVCVVAICQTMGHLAAVSISWYIVHKKGISEV